MEQNKELQGIAIHKIYKEDDNKLDSDDDIKYFNSEM